MLADTSDGHIRITSIIVALIFYFVNYFVRKMSNIKKISPLDNEFLQRTTVIDKPASCLWYMGRMPTVQPTVAVVGSRKPTSYGRAVSQQIVSELARHGVIIVSGLAIGHDSIAHKTCLEAGGTTVAVIGNGLNDIHPHSNQQLAAEIINNNGAIISEYPPDEPVYPSHFLERNRLISALADIVVIIEAGERSGTLNTASHALSQGKDVMAVPGNITSPLSRGCNRLIAQGATPVLSAQDILDRLDITNQPLAKQTTNHIRFDSPDAQRLYNLILAGEMDGDKLLQQSHLSASEFSMAITMLELNGYIKSLGNNKYAIK